MGNPSRYWELFEILPSGNGCGYKARVLAAAKYFFLQEFSTWANQENIIDESVQNQLFELLARKKSTNVELCLRSYISYFILQSCIHRARLFSAGGRINYRDLLPFVLNDDGETPKGTHIPFSIEILYSFCRSYQCSFPWWIDFKVKRHQELNKFLLEFDIEIRSGWAILNKAVKSHLDNQQDKQILTAFHAVYRRDRIQQHHSRLGGKCPEPTQKQIDEMIQYLCQQNVFIDSPYKMRSQLERITKQLRQQSIWGQTGYPVTESIDEVSDEVQQLFDHTIEFEQLELQEFCHQQLFTCLDKALRQIIKDHIIKQNKSRGYAAIAHLIKPILMLIYVSGKSQAEIGKELGISQLQVSRLVNPSNLIKNVRRRTLEMLFNNILVKVRELGYAEYPLKSDYFDNLLQQLEVYIDKQVFHQALAELRMSRNAMNSLYAQRLPVVLNELTRGF